MRLTPKPSFDSARVPFPSGRFARLVPDPLFRSNDGRGFLFGIDSPLKTMHIIRLRGPWNKRFADDSDWTRITVPESAADDTSSESVAGKDSVVCYYRRNFNRPTGLGPNTPVYLRVQRCGGRLLTVKVNGHAMECDQWGAEADIGRILRSHNELELCLSGGDKFPKLSGEITLRIGEDPQITKDHVPVTGDQSKT